MPKVQFLLATLTYVLYNYHHTNVYAVLVPEKLRFIRYAIIVNMKPVSDSACAQCSFFYRVSLTLTGRLHLFQFYSIGVLVQQ